MECVLLLFLDAAQVLPAAQSAPAAGGATALSVDCCLALQFLLQAPSLHARWRQLVAPTASGAASNAADVLLDSVQAGLQVSLLRGWPFRLCSRGAKNAARSVIW